MLPLRKVVRSVWPFLLPLLMSFCPDRSQAQTVSSENGNIVYRSPAGVPRVLTHSGQDYDPSLSQDGSKVVFARKLGVPTLGAAGPPSELLLLDLSDPASAPPRVILGHPVERGLHYFTSPKPSLNNRSVYFLVPGWAATTNGLYSLDLQTNTIRFVSDAITYWVHPPGEYGGRLIVWRNPMFVGGGRYDEFDLITAAGKQEGVVGFREADVQHYLAMQERSAPAKPSRPVSEQR